MSDCSCGEKCPNCECQQAKLYQVGRAVERSDALGERTQLVDFVAHLRKTYPAKFIPVTFVITDEEKKES